jgi:cobalt transporter subunit CbtA
MNVRILLAAIVAGLIGGVFATGIQALRVTPLILAAEAYENAPVGAENHHAAPAATGYENGAAVSGGHSHGEEAVAWAPEDGIERTAYTLLSNMLVGVGFALLVTAAIVLTNTEISLGAGMLWGLAGFIVFVLAPNLGLPPELPGTAAADLEARQAWWLATVACTAGGLFLLAFNKQAVWLLAGIGLVLAPHIFGAPQPETHESLAPASLAVEFVVASIATAFVYWLFLGGLLGYLLGKVVTAEQVPEVA